jgi:hypothetical protein
LWWPMKKDVRYLEYTWSLFQNLKCMSSWHFLISLFNTFFLFLSFTLFPCLFVSFILSFFLATRPSRCCGDAEVFCFSLLSLSFFLSCGFVSFSFIFCVFISLYHYYYIYHSFHQSRPIVYRIPS